MADDSSIGLKGETMFIGEIPKGRIGGFWGIRLALELPGVDIEGEDAPKLPMPAVWFWLSDNP